MSDRTTAALFEQIFEYLANEGSKDAKKFAKKMWVATKEFDFDPYQLNSDEALIDLGLAEECEHGYIHYADEHRHYCDGCNKENGED